MADSDNPLVRALLSLGLPERPNALAANEYSDYGYGNPEQRFNVATTMAMTPPTQEPSWARKNLPKSLADFLNEAFLHAPLAVPAMRGRVMSNGLRPEDYAIAKRMDRPGFEEGGLAFDANALSSLDPHAMRQFKSNTPQHSSTYFALPEEVGFWSKQVPANAPNPDLARPTPTGNPHRDAAALEQWKRLMKSPDNRPFEVIDGGKGKRLTPEETFDINAPLTKEDWQTIRSLLGRNPNKPKDPF